MVKFYLERPSDKGAGQRPAIPLGKVREGFVNDVHGANGATKLDRAGLRKKYGKHFGTDRAFDNWLKWARDLVGVEDTAGNG